MIFKHSFYMRNGMYICVLTISDVGCFSGDNILKHRSGNRSKHVVFSILEHFAANFVRAKPHYGEGRKMCESDSRERERETPNQHWSVAMLSQWYFGWFYSKKSIFISQKHPNLHPVLTVLHGIMYTWCLMHCCGCVTITKFETFWIWEYHNPYIHYIHKLIQFKWDWMNQIVEVVVYSWKTTTFNFSVVFKCILAHI